MIKHSLTRSQRNVPRTSLNVQISACLKELGFFKLFCENLFFGFFAESVSVPVAGMHVWL